MLMLRALETTIAALLGLAFGSFLNVCASRWPEGESIVAPRSHCRSCGRTLDWYENVPLVSWLALRGRCRGCGAQIGWRYPLVELAVGVAWAIAGWQAVPAIVAAVSIPGATAPLIFNASLLCIEKMILSWLLIALAVLDMEHLWLPDRLTLGGALIGLPFVFARFAISWASPRWTSGMASHRTHIYEEVVHWVIGVLLAPAIVLFTRWAYRAVRKQEGMGLGDAKLMLLLAVWLGLSHTLLAFVLGVIFGTVFAVVLLVFPAARREAGTKWSLARLPFGTFLCIGGLVSAFWGTPMIHAYLRTAGF
jgi:leader peptidase (prepilin peptidase) / N-methyltransferase